MGGRRGRHWSRDLLCWRSRIASARRRCQRHGARRVHADSCGRSACAARGNKQNGHVTVSSSKLRALEHSTKKGTFLMRSEEHTSELQSRLHLVCRLLLETKKPTTRPPCVRALPPPTTAWLYTTCTCSRSGSPTPLLHTPCPLSSHQHLTPNTTHTSTVS